MKHKSYYIFSTMAAFILLAIYFFQEPSNKEIIPQLLIGEWSGKQKVTVRFKVGAFKFDFAPAPDSLEMKIKIDEKGNVNGSLGTAAFKDCKVTVNRGWFGKQFNTGSDFIIVGNLSGTIFPSDTIMSKTLSFPFNVSSNMVIEGTIFQKQGAGVFPMAYVHVIKN